MGTVVINTMRCGRPNNNKKDTMPCGRPNNNKKDTMPCGRPNNDQKDSMPCGRPNNESYNNNRVGYPWDLTPIIILKAKYIQNIPMDRDLIVLIDSGSTNTMIKISAFPMAQWHQKDQIKGQPQQMEF
jgi:hypothetical protein